MYMIVMYKKKLTRKSSVISCSVIELILCRAFSAESNGWNATNFTTRWNFENSFILLCTSFKKVPISSFSNTENKPKPDADSNST